MEQGNHNNQILTLQLLKQIAGDDYPEVLHDVLLQNYTFLRNVPELAEYSDSHVAQMAFELTEEFRNCFSGSQVYIPQARFYVLSRRDKEIYEQFNGTNHLELARRFGLTEFSIRKVIKKITENKIRQNQGSLEFEE